MILRLLKVLLAIIWYLGIIPISLISLSKYIINGNGVNVFNWYVKLDPFYETL